jgi:hypothetical protein
MEELIGGSSVTANLEKLRVCNALENSHKINEDRGK